MTRLIERQRISRRPPVVDVPDTLHESSVEPDHGVVVPGPREKTGATRFRKGIRPIILFSVLGLFAILTTLFVVGARRSNGEGSDLPLVLPEDHSAEVLVSDYVYGASIGGSGDLRAAAAESLMRFAPIAYTVRRGDTVSEIAASFGIRLDTIISYNSITDVRGVPAGSVLQIPAFAGEEAVDGVVYTVRRGDTLGAIAGQHDVELLPILDANQIESDVIRPGEVLFIPDAVMATNELRRALGTLFIRPVAGRLTSPFGARIDPFKMVNSFHYGVDWANVTGTPVKASNHGTVVAVVTENRVFGNYIVIDHRDQFQTLYAHLSTILVSEGDRVEQGAIIGKVGNTGNSTGPHLHFTIYKNHEPVNPLNYVH